MNNKFLVCTFILLLTACKSNDIRNIADTVSDIASIGSGTSTTPNPSYEYTNQQYSVKTQKFHITEATRMNPEVGQIRSIRTEKNPEGITMVKFESYHWDSGAAMKSRQYLYAVTNEGWLSKEPHTIFRTNAEIINSGTYYLKAESTTGKFYTSGELKLERGLTNIVSIDLQ